MIKSLAEKIYEVKKAIYKQIKELPQNENIQNATDSPKTFIMNYSELSKDKVLAPYFYDFKQQYKMIVESLGQTRIENFEDKLKKIIESGKVVYQKNNYQLNPKVIEFLKTLEL